MGQSTAIGIGGYPVVGLHFRELLEMFQNDTETEAIVLIGEIGGKAEAVSYTHLDVYKRQLSIVFNTHFLHEFKTCIHFIFCSLYKIGRAHV